MNEPKCPKCGKPLSFELGTHYCHGCKLIIDPSVLKPPMTYADWIRNMDDDELAEWWAATQIACILETLERVGIEYKEVDEELRKEVAKDLLERLQQPAEG